MQAQPTPSHRPPLEKYDSSLEIYQYSQESLNESKSYSDIYLKISKFLTGNKKIENIDIEKLRDDLFGAPISGKSIHKILGYLDEQIYEVKMLQVAPIISEFYPSLLEKAREVNQKSKDKRTITYEVINEFGAEGWPRGGRGGRHEWYLCFRDALPDGRPHFR